jgi:hypothetical protein
MDFNQNFGWEGQITFLCPNSYFSAELSACRQRKKSRNVPKRQKVFCRFADASNTLHLFPMAITLSLQVLMDTIQLSHMHDEVVNATRRLRDMRSVSELLAIQQLHQNTIINLLAERLRRLTLCSIAGSPPASITIYRPPSNFWSYWVVFCPPIERRVCQWTV